ncbi:histidine phosphatase family protein [Halomicroarcula sp. GCM10025709]|uniref:histidine phosphatase family protein n=1 Tax=Haloarcula TaxID=2237 RepID=UPI0024C33B0F|nr:histidine phosphatase family protein [Halomicroarcula sp. YJ-61-S]
MSDADAATVLVARHGETHWNRESRVQGWAPTGLTDRGQEQAAALGEAVAERYAVDRIVSSDLQRTRETTAGVLDGGSDLPDPAFDADWRERGFGVLQGLLAEDLFERYPAHDDGDSVSALPAAPENGETVAGFRDRVRDSWTRLVRTVEPGETTLLVTHGGVIKVLLATVDERSLDAALAAHSQDNCAVNEVRVADDRTTLVAEELTDWR